MLKTLNGCLRSFTANLKNFLVAYVGQSLIRILLFTCRWEVTGVERFKETARSKKCILILWHNRLTLAPFILYRFAKSFIYTAMVSKSRDGELISSVIRSYKSGRTLRVGHQTRHQALMQLVREIDKQKSIMIITPDGPRGPIYHVKAGTAWAALQTGASVIPLTWEADRYWEFKTWDRLRLPKPFSSIKVSFKEPVVFKKEDQVSLEDAQETLRTSLAD